MKKIILENESYKIYQEKDKIVGKEKKHFIKKENNLCIIKKVSKENITSAIIELDIEKNIKRSKQVAIKVNIGGGITGLYGTYSEPETLEVIIEAIKELGVKVFVCEADMRGFIMNKSMLRRRGYLDILVKTNTEFVNLSEVENIEFYCLYLDIPLFIPKVLIEPDTFIISFAPIKYHWECGVSLSQKNMYGALSTGNKSIYHLDVASLDNIIAASARILSPHLSILGGNILSSGLGPHFSIPIKFGYLILSNNAWVADKVAADILDYPYNKVKYAMINCNNKEIEYKMLKDSDDIPEEVKARIIKFKIKYEDTLFWRNLLALQYHIPHKLQRILASVLELPFALTNTMLFSWRGRVYKMVRDKS